MGAVDQFEEMRCAFEHWFSDAGESPRAIARDMNGEYRLLQASSAWSAWKAAWNAARRGRRLRRDEVIALISSLSNNSADHDIEFAQRVMDACGTPVIPATPANTPEDKK
jgi:hypothetical protein